MKFTDLGIILDSSDFQEKSSIMKILTQERGLVRAFIKYKGKPPLPQRGDIVNFHYYSRLPENLGNINLEVTFPTSSMIIFEDVKLYVLNAALDLLNNTLREFDPCPKIYNALETLLMSLIENDKKELYLQDYALFELALLDNLGFGLNLLECAVTGTENNLHYISPKSGNAVTQEVGIPYQDKLFCIPAFWHTDQDNPIKTEIAESLRITEHFLKLRVFYPLQKDLPHSHGRIMNHIKGW